MRKRCPVCEGRKYIRLPLRQELVAAMPVEELIAPVQNTYRDYPCPECAPTVNVDRVRVVECHSRVIAEYENDPEFMESINEELAISIGKEMAEAGYMRFRKEPAEHDDMTRIYQATVGVVGPEVVDYLEKEHRRREDAFADKVAKRIKYEIDNWGSYYANPTINKNVAYDLINDAVKYAKETRPK